MKIEVTLNCPRCGADKNGIIDTDEEVVYCLLCNSDLTLGYSEFVEPYFAPFVPNRDVWGE